MPPDPLQTLHQRIDEHIAKQRERIGANPQRDGYQDWYEYADDPGYGETGDEAFNDDFLSWTYRNSIVDQQRDDLRYQAEVVAGGSVIGNPGQWLVELFGLIEDPAGSNVYRLP